MRDVNNLREESEESEDSDIYYVTSITDGPEVVHGVLMGRFG